MNLFFGISINQDQNPGYYSKGLTVNVQNYKRLRCSYVINKKYSFNYFLKMQKKGETST